MLAARAASLFFSSLDQSNSFFVAVALLLPSSMLQVRIQSTMAQRYTCAANPFFKHMSIPSSFCIGELSSAFCRLSLSYCRREKTGL